VSNDYERLFIGHLIFLDFRFGYVMTEHEQAANVEIVEDDVEDVEEWRVIGGFDNYSISNLGRVRNDRTGRILKAVLNNGTGYLVVCLCNRGSRTKAIHKLVASAFLGDSEGLEVNHIDRNKQNNNVGNLEYCTRSANERNKNSYKGHQVEYVDELPAGAEPIIEVRGRAVAEGYYRNGFEFYVRVGPQFRRLTHSRNNQNGWRVKIRGPDGGQIFISWTA
jgi:hypothetical protein